MRLSNNEIDEGKLTYDLALLCTKRYLDEVKFSDTVSDFEVSSGGTLAEKATELFRGFYLDIRYSLSFPHKD